MSNTMQVRAWVSVQGLPAATYTREVAFVFVPRPGDRVHFSDELELTVGAVIHQADAGAPIVDLEDMPANSPKSHESNIARLVAAGFKLEEQFSDSELATDDIWVEDTLAETEALPVAGCCL